MSIETRNIPLQNTNGFGSLDFLTPKDPTTVKILKIAGSILGIGLLAGLTFSLSLKVGVAVALYATGLVAIVASLILIACNQTDEPVEEKKALEPKKKVQIGGARCRPFQKEDAPNVVGTMNSVEFKK